MPVASVRECGLGACFEVNYQVRMVVALSDCVTVQFMSEFSRHNDALRAYRTLKGKLGVTWPMFVEEVKMQMSPSVEEVSKCGCGRDYASEDDGLCDACYYEQKEKR